MKTNVNVFKKLLAAVFVGFLISCVTVNVHFPEGAVQRAADDYVKELYRAKQQAEEEVKAKVQNEGAQLDIRTRLLSSLSTVAHAQVQFKVDTPKAKDILSKQSKRLSDIDTYKKQGVVGEASDGLLVVRGMQLKKLLARKINQLVNDENADREALYAEVISANGIQKAQEDSVRLSFYQSFLKASPKGTPFEQGGIWSNK